MSKMGLLVNQVHQRSLAVEEKRLAHCFSTDEFLCLFFSSALRLERVMMRGLLCFTIVPSIGMNSSGFIDGIDFNEGSLWWGEMMRGLKVKEGKAYLISEKNISSRRVTRYFNYKVANLSGHFSNLSDSPQPEGEGEPGKKQKKKVVHDHHRSAEIGVLQAFLGREKQILQSSLHLCCA